MKPAFALTLPTASAKAGSGDRSVLVCHGVSCSANGGGDRLLSTLQALAPHADLNSTGCLGACGERANTLIDGRIVPSHDVIAKAGLRPLPRSRRARSLKSAGDKAMSADPARAARCYALALRALPPLELAPGARARVGANYAAALLEMQDFEASLAAAQEAVRAQPIDAAWLRAAQAYEVLGDAQAAQLALQNAGKETKQKFVAWNRARRRSNWWTAITGGAGPRRTGAPK